MQGRLKIVGAVLGAAIALCSSFAALAQNAATFRVGAVLPKTGPYSQFGVTTEQGLRAATARINRMGGINGRQVELVIRDDASNPGRSLLAAKDLLGEQKVDFLYPGLISGLVLSVLPYSTEQKVFTITNAATPKVGDPKEFPYSFQVVDLTIKRVPAMIAAAKKLGGTKAGILVTTNPSQMATGDQLNAELTTKYGVPIAGYKQFTAESKDVTPMLQSLRDAGADVILFDAAARDNLRVLAQGLQTLGWKVKVVVAIGSYSGDIVEQVPAVVANQLYFLNYRVGVRTGGAPAAPVQEFIDEMKKLGQIQNLALSALGHDALFLAKWTYETAQKEKGNTSGDSLKAVAESLGTRKAPEGLVLFENPAYSTATHTTGNADYSKFWGLVTVSPLQDGTYAGEPLSVPQ